jgi:hypothetical protein
VTSVSGFPQSEAASSLRDGCHHLTGAWLIALQGQLNRRIFRSGSPSVTQAITFLRAHRAYSPRANGSFGIICRAFLRKFSRSQSRKRSRYK